MSPQHQDRRDTWEAFKESKHGVLVCTDIASRGLDDTEVWMRCI